MWGELADKPIRHHKFPDVLVSPIMESPVMTYDGNNMAPVMQDSNAVFPMGVKINNGQVSNLILNSNLTQDQKDDIVGFKIVRGDRSTNRSTNAKQSNRQSTNEPTSQQTNNQPSDPLGRRTDLPLGVASALGKNTRCVKT